MVKGNRDQRRMVERRRRFAADRDVFFQLRPGAVVQVQWIYAEWEPYGGDPDRAPIRSFPMQVLSERQWLPGSSGWALELGAAPDTPAAQRRRAQLLLRDEKDAPKRSDGGVDFDRTGAPNSVVMVWRNSAGHLCSGAWVHLQRPTATAQMQLLR